jgi:hypothetical protein
MTGGRKVAEASRAIYRNFLVMTGGFLVTPWLRVQSIAGQTRLVNGWGENFPWFSQSVTF